MDDRGPLREPGLETAEFVVVAGVTGAENERSAVGGVLNDVHGADAARIT